MSYYNHHPELGEQDYEERCSVLQEIADEDEAMEIAQSDADADKAFFAARGEVVQTGLDDETADPGECPLWVEPVVEPVEDNGPAIGTWAFTARMMAEGDDSGFDWDAWKDEMKDREMGI